MTQPEAIEGKSRSLGNGDDRIQRTFVSDIDGEMKLRAACMEQILEKAGVVRKLVSADVSKRNLSSSSTKHAIVIKNHSTVCGDPCIGLQAVGTELQCESEGLECVLRSVRAGSTMRKGDGDIDERWEPLLHEPRLRHVSYDDGVFNLSGSEIVFLLLAGLVVLGPERLPGVIRRVGQVYGDIKRAAQGVERELKETFAEPLQELQSSVRDVSQTAREAGNFFGVVDPEPSPPMRPEQATLPEIRSEQRQDSERQDSERKDSEPQEPATDEAEQNDGHGNEYKGRESKGHES